MNVKHSTLPEILHNMQRRIEVISEDFDSMGNVESYITLQNLAREMNNLSSFYCAAGAKVPIINALTIQEIR